MQGGEMRKEVIMGFSGHTNVDPGAEPHSREGLGRPLLAQQGQLQAWSSPTGPVFHGLLLFLRD